MSAVQSIFEQYIKDHLNLRKNHEGVCTGESEGCEKCGVIEAHLSLRSELHSRLLIMEELESSGAEDIYSFLTGSYKRKTINRPPKDVDFFIVLKQDEYADFEPDELLGIIMTTLVDIYPDKPLDDFTVQTHSVSVKLTDTFGIDIIPAFEDGENYLIPEALGEGKGRWISSNPKKHEDFVRDANEQSDGMVVPVARLLKDWRKEKVKPLDIDVKSFHLEMLAATLLGQHRPKDYADGLRIFFAEAPRYLDKPSIPDPANPGSFIDADISDEDRLALKELIATESITIDHALTLAEAGDEEGAIAEWVKIFPHEAFGSAKDTVSRNVLSEAVKTGGLYQAGSSSLSIEPDSGGQPVPRSSSWSC